MPPNANDALLSRICGQEETLAEARRIFPIATTRTKPGSGHNLGTLTTGLPAICAYVASTRLNNSDVSLENARQASCLRASDFNRALRIVNAALEAELSPRKRKGEITYDMLHEKYDVRMPFSNFTLYLRQAEHALLQLGAPYKIESTDVRCSIFFWASSAIKTKELPSLDEFAQDNALLSKRLAPIIRFLSDKCSSLRSKLMEAVKTSSRPPSPTKASQAGTPRTPRRSPTKSLRELPTRDSVRKQRKRPVEEEVADQKEVGSQHVDTDLVEAPTRKRKLDSQPLSPVKRAAIDRSPFPLVTPTSKIAPPISPTKPRTTNTPTITSPLRRSARHALQDEVDDNVVMDLDEEEDDIAIKKLNIPLIEDSVDGDVPAMATRRFRPVYQDIRQWYSRDVRTSRMRHEAKKRSGLEEM